MTHQRLGTARNHLSRSLKLIGVRRTEAHTPIDSHAPRDAVKFFPEFLKFMVDYHDRATMAEGQYRVMSLHKKLEEAEAAVRDVAKPIDREYRIKELKNSGWTVLLEYHRESASAEEGGGR